MSEKKTCGIEFAPGVACVKDAGHDIPEYPDLDYGQYSQRSTVVSDIEWERRHRFEWLVPDPEPSAPEARRNLRSVVIRYLQLPMTARQQILDQLGIESRAATYGGAALGEVREKGLIEAFADAVDRRRPDTTSSRAGDS
jgi:hypothetical protein